MSRSTNEMQGQISMTFLTVSKKQQGFSLIEVLIALIIMSVGMLGIAGLYVQSLQAGRTSGPEWFKAVTGADAGPEDVQ